MKFSKLAQYFSKLESTASRNSMVEILAELFKETSVEEIDKVIYLTQGRVAPLFDAVEFQMADKMVVKSLALAYESDVEKVTTEYKKVGDLGTVAEEFSKKTSSSNKTVEDVFLKLKQITEISGEGSVEKKVQTLSDIFQENDSLSNRFLARIPVDKMRLGFSDMTILEGLSWMLDGTKKHKDEIEAAYNIRPDLGYICAQVKKSGMKGLSHVEPVVGTPILVMRAERLTSAEAILEKVGGQCAVEPKLDGLRTQLHIRKSKSANQGKEVEVRIYSRGLENVTLMYPDLVVAAKEEINVDEVILDGEAIGFDPETGRYLQFQQTVQRKRKYDIDLFSQNVPLRLVVYDCLYYNGKNMINESYQERRKIVEQLTEKNKIIVTSPMDIVDKPEQLKKIFDESLKKGLEGIMAKKLDGVYQAGARGWNWIKFKKSYEGEAADTIDCVVMGIDYGEGKRNAFGVGSFLVGIYDVKSDSYKTISKVGTGLTDDEWRELKVQSEQLKVSEKPQNYDVNKLMNCDVWLKPKLVGEFKSDELTKSPMHTSGWAMRFPRLEKWRPDKKATDSTSLDEILKLIALKKEETSN